MAKTKTVLRDFVLDYCRAAIGEFVDLVDNKGYKNGERAIKKTLELMKDRFNRQYRSR
jgi:hypothetical protein